MANHEAQQVYARPYGDSNDPQLRGHITSGWTEGSVSVSTVGDEEVGRSQIVRNSHGETQRIPTDEHARIQRIMAALATKYGEIRMPGEKIPVNVDNELADAPSASSQLSESGIIDRVPGAVPTHIDVHFADEEVNIPVVVSNEAVPARQPDVVIDEKSLDVSAAPEDDEVSQVKARLEELLDGLSASDSAALWQYAAALHEYELNTSMGKMSPQALERKSAYRDAVKHLNSLTNK